MMVLEQNAAYEIGQCVNKKERQKEYAKKHYLKNRQAMIDKAKARRNEIKNKVIEYKLSHPCQCGESHPAALDFHHYKGKKSFNISDALVNGYTWRDIKTEIKKCIVICRNCHAKLHWNKK